MKFNLREDYKFPVFLVALLLFLFIPDAFGPSLRGLLNNILFLGLIFAGLILVETHNKLKRAIIFLTAILVISARIIGIFYELGTIASIILFMVVFLYFVIIEHELMVQIFKSNVITFNVIFGAFTGYIVIGILGSFIFQLIYTLYPGSFHIQGDSMEELFYYSFITLTTIGYGDIAPLTPMARNVAILIGLVGQFYIATIMALIIGKFFQNPGKDQ